MKQQEVHGFILKMKQLILIVILQAPIIFKSFKYKAKLLGKSIAQPVPNAANGNLKNATISVSLKILSNFWRSLPLINCKVGLKLK